MSRLNYKDRSVNTVKEIVAVCSQNRAAKSNALYEPSAEFCNVKVVGGCS